MYLLEAVLFLLVTTVWESSTFTPAPCDDNFVEGLKKFPECYPNGQPPNKRSGGERLTFIVLPKGLLPQNVNCVEGTQGGSEALVTVHYNNDQNITLKYQQTFDKIYIEETDAAGIKYRIYVIHNEHHVYAYYRCVEGGNSTGTHSGHIAIGCKYVKNKDSEKVVNTALKCFEKLDIKSYENVKPCNCQ